jgi:hypothetical protein
MNVMLKERSRKRFRNCGEALDNDVDVVQPPPLGWLPMGSKLQLNRQAPRERASQAVLGHCRDDTRRSTRVRRVQQKREHVPMISLAPWAAES